MDRKWIILIVLILVAVIITYFYLTGFLIKPPTNCGDDVCQIDEDTSSCCIDCGCYKSGDVCNVQQNRCEHKDISLTDERAGKLARKYFEDKGEIVTSVNILGIFTYQNQLAKSVIVNIKGAEEFSSVLVTEDGKVIPVQTHPK